MNGLAARNISRKLSFIILLLFALPNCRAKTGVLNNVDTTQIIFSHSIETEEFDSVLIRVTAKSWNAPVTWYLQVISKDKLIYAYRSIDSLIDAFFEDTSYVGGCTNYLTCKKNYYLEIIKEGLIKNFNCENDPNNICSQSVPTLTKKFYLDSLKFSAERTKESLIALQKQLQSTNKVLVIPMSPVENYKTIVFDKKNGVFVPIHNE